MAQRNFTLSTAKVKHKLALSLTVAMMKGSKWAQFMAQSDNAVIKTELNENKLAGTVTIPLQANLTGSGVEGNADFDTNEDVLNFLHQTVSLESFGNSVKSGEKLKILNQVQFVKFTSTAKSALKSWGMKKMDDTITRKLSTDATNMVISAHPDSVTPADIVKGDVFSVADVRQALDQATSGEDAEGNPRPKLRPIQVIVEKDAHGIEVTRKIYLMKVGNKSAKHIKLDPEWTALQEAATTNNLDSPLFSSKLGVVDDVVLINDGTVSDDDSGIFTSDQISAYAGTSVKTEINLFLGATAVLMPMDGGFEWYEDTYDMKKKAKVGIDRDMGVAKAKFQGTTAAEKETVWHNNDYGLIVVISAVK